MIDVGDEQVQIAIGIEVCGGGSHTRDGFTVAVERAAVNHCYFLERTVAAVMPQERRRLIIGHVDIDKAVAVEITRQQTKPVSRHRVDPGRAGDVLKTAVAKVSI